VHYLLGRTPIRSVWGEAKGPQQQETFVVGAGGALSNVFVHVKGGLGSYVYDPPSEQATLDPVPHFPTDEHALSLRMPQPSTPARRRLGDDMRRPLCGAFREFCSLAA